MAGISIIVPVYRAEKFLRRCVDSILSQTYQDIELILVDDGSPDCSGMLCDQYAKEDNRITVLHQTNGGVASARNAGLDVASGEYITFVDSDDYIEPDMYERMLWIADEHNCDVVICDCLKEYPGRSELYTHNIREGYYSEKEMQAEYYPHLLIMENVEYPASISNYLCVFRRELCISKIDGSELRYEFGIRFSEDLLFGARMMYRAKSFFYMKGVPLYHYCMNDGSATHKYVPDKWNDFIQLYNKICVYFGECQKYNFQKQIDLCLLFFVYNAVEDLLQNSGYDMEKKKIVCRMILDDAAVRGMFGRIHISALKISLKQKLKTFLYKHHLVGFLCILSKRK